MQLHQIKPQHKKKTKKRVGRGGKRGTYSGKGNKGQKSRAGANMQPLVREYFKRYPKLRGYRFKAINKEIEIVNFSELEKNFKESEIVSPESLLKKGLVSKIKGRKPKVKILANGNLKKKLKFKNCFFSKKAQEKLNSL
jgi:large subunit ribosomal protein L15